MKVLYKLQNKTKIQYIEIFTSSNFLPQSDKFEITNTEFECANCGCNEQLQSQNNIKILLKFIKYLLIGDYGVVTLKYMGNIDDLEEYIDKFSRWDKFAVMSPCSNSYSGGWEYAF